MGPNATAAPETADQAPMALARSVGSVNTLVRMASVAGKTSAAPIPIAARAAMSCPEVWAKAPSVLMAAKTTRPICSAPLRPSRSPIAPPVSNRPANTKL
ncbi:unannotated protein [freshwater metagenome]|uniref:Unannotated protein n=1 Tax=freshwater metagenome TaxID=449393 RepID=A0A6J5YGR5_9ZZZZ